jgi:hypothetical protein
LFTGFDAFEIARVRNDMGQRRRVIRFAPAPRETALGERVAANERRR